MPDTIIKPSKPTATYVPENVKSYQYEVLNIVPPKVEFMVLKDQQPLTKMVADFETLEPEFSDVREAIAVAIRRDVDRLHLLADMVGYTTTVEI